MNSERAKIDARASILVVEDAPDLMRLLVRSLETSGYRAVPAPDGESALEVFEADGAIDLTLRLAFYRWQPWLSLWGNDVNSEEHLRLALSPFRLSSAVLKARTQHSPSKPDLRLLKPHRRCPLMDRLSHFQLMHPISPLTHSLEERQ